MDYVGRLRRIRQEMAKREVDLLYLTRGANLWYLTGVKRRGAELTDHNAYGDYVCGAYLTQDKLTLVGPRMGGSAWRAEAEGKPYVTEVVIFDEHRDPADVQKEVLNRHNPDEVNTLVGMLERPASSVERLACGATHLERPASERWLQYQVAPASRVVPI